MYLLHLELLNFRNYQQAQIDFSKGANIIYGYNGQGKTNLLESISFLCLTKSFRTSFDSEAINFENKFFKIKGKFISDKGIEKEVEVYLNRFEGKRIFLNEQRVRRFSDVFGLFPVVIFTPEEERITLGSPSDRRRFLDITISQVSPPYLEDLQNYQKVLRHRNKILLEGRESGGEMEGLLQPWDANLIEYGVKILLSRKNFLGEFLPLLKECYQRLSPQENLSLTYLPSVPVEDEDTISESFQYCLKQSAALEKARGMTLVGPHRDELIFEINGRDIRKYGSRGQHRTALVALKIAEYLFLREKRGENPVLLLDDPQAIIDEIRQKKIREFLRNLGQVLITTSRSDLRFSVAGEKSRYFRVVGGRVFPEG